MIDFPQAGEQWLGHFSSSCFCPWRFLLFSPHLSMALFPHSSITGLFNELASTAWTPSTPHPLHQPRCRSLSIWRNVYTLCPLAPCRLSTALSSVPISLSILPQWHFCLECLTLPHPLQISDSNMIPVFYQSMKYPWISCWTSAYPEKKAKALSAAFNGKYLKDPSN